MPLLTYRDPLPCRPRRVLVAGTSGSGKTTLARVIARTIEVPHVEIDGLFHGPGWVPRAAFEADVENFSSRPDWVTEWQYSAVLGLLAHRADLMVWLDLPTAVVMSQVIRRTLWRGLGRQPLWNGNVEPPLRTIVSDPDHVVRWAWKTRFLTADRIDALMVDRPDLPVVHLRRHLEARHWVTQQL